MTLFDMFLLILHKFTKYLFFSLVFVCTFIHLYVIFKMFIESFLRNLLL